MTIGPYTLYPIETGSFALDGGAMFGVVPKALWERTNPPDEKNRIPMAARALLLIGGGRTILVDAGNGTKLNERLRAIYRIDTGRTDLLSSLRARGIAPEEVTDVLLTHLHFDHAGGSTFREQGEVKPTFPKARYHVQREHWKAALHPTERDRASFFPDDYMPLHERGLLHLVDGEGELFPGVSVRLMHGHTTALQCPVVSDGRSTLFYCADLLPTIAHVQLPWIMAYDLRPLVTLEEKRAVLARALEEEWTLFFEHDPVIAAGRVRMSERGIVFAASAEMDR